MPGQSVRGRSASRKAKKPPKIEGSPLTPHASGQYCAKIEGKVRYFGRDHDEALGRYRLVVSGHTTEKQKSKGKAKSKKPPKIKGSPLTPHASGQYCGRVAGRLQYFGADHEDALRRYLDARAGIEEDETRVSVRHVCDAYLDSQQAKVDAGNLSERTLRDYHDMAKRFASRIGRNRLYQSLKPSDFASLRTSYRWAASSTINREIRMVKVMINWAEKSGYGRPNLGPDFVPVPARVQRKERAEKGELMFEAHQCHKIIKHCSPQLKAMCLLGLNLGFGPKDCADLKRSDIDWQRRWFASVRNKTGVQREGSLWDETIEALEDAIKNRPDPRTDEDEDLVFLTKYGNRWVRDGSSDNPISKEITKILKALGIHRVGHSFYSFRRTHRTVADDAGDTTAARRIMGHVAKAGDMDDVYVQRIKKRRIRAICEHVRRWYVVGGYTAPVTIPRGCKRWGGAER
ncbi:tyrosine-type recombinase/integrase [Roseiconus lacunae]|uniref:tyrosine-type recombinase/integrase n=1 Tax=Roseiconus lacunae TaxID=2605694 RepID=UPI001E58FA79|nr:site-specific integrase [Roseiconus lacunae]MCD0459971.1 tyrosine-type recombinase/integrase [Roseiconus lacunae]